MILTGCFSIQLNYDAYNEFKNELGCFLMT